MFINVILVKKYNDIMSTSVVMNVFNFRISNDCNFKNIIVDIDVSIIFIYVGILNINFSVNVVLMIFGILFAMIVSFVIVYSAYRVGFGYFFCMYCVRFYFVVSVSCIVRFCMYYFFSVV